MDGVYVLYPPWYGMICWFSVHAEGNLNYQLDLTRFAQSLYAQCMRRMRLGRMRPIQRLQKIDGCRGFGL